MSNPLTPPPPTGIGILDRWLALLWRKLTAAGEILWTQVSKAGSSFMDLENRAHDHTTADGSGPMTNDEHDGFVELATSAAPSTPAAGKMRLYAQDAAGVARLRAMHSTGSDLAFFRDAVVRVKNTSGGTINKGEMAYVTGATGNFPTIAKAKADAAATMPAAGMVLATATDNSFTTLQFAGEMTGLDTSAFAEGARVFVSPTTAGALTTTEPQHPYLSQAVGVITKASAGDGRVQLFVSLQHEGDDFGSNRNSFAIGDTTAGAKTLNFVANFTGGLQWTPTAARTATLPDKSGTVAFTNDKLSAFAATTSAELAGVLSDEAGTGGGFVRADGAAINPASIGATTPGSGAFTTLTTTGNASLSGNVGVGLAANPAFALAIGSGAIAGSGATTQVGVNSDITGSSAATTLIAAFNLRANTSAAAYTVADLVGLRVLDAVKGAGSTITNQHGVFINNLIDGDNNYGITSQVSSGATKWNIYASGTAQNAFAGNVRIGSTVAPVATLDVTGTLSVSGNATLGDASTDTLTITGTAVSTPNGLNFDSNTLVIDAANNRVGVGKASPSVAVDVTGEILATTAIRSSGATNGIGYATGAGGTVTQLTSKATGVTLNKVCGQITTAADALAATTRTSFTLTNSAIAATDSINIHRASGGTANAYRIEVDSVAAGSCVVAITNITAGSLSEAVVINFAILKGVTA